MKVLVKIRGLLRCYDFRKVYVDENEGIYSVNGSYDDGSNWLIYSTKSKEDANEMLFSIFQNDWTTVLDKYDKLYESKADTSDLIKFMSIFKQFDCSSDSNENNE